MTTTDESPSWSKTPRRRLLNKQFHLKKEATFKAALETLSRSERIFVSVLVGLLLISVGGILYSVNQFLLVEVPAKGGSTSEGIVGSPRFINPLLALSDADRDLTALVYSGLLKATPEGKFIPDLAESYTISEDGLIYNFVLRDDAVFHDGEPVTTNDIVFTIGKAKDSLLKSPKRANWEGVGVEQVNEREINFVLQQPYAPFLENTTIGILPMHMWEHTNTEQFAFSTHNIEPIGSGPYKIQRIERSSVGIPELYEFTVFEDYAIGRPYIDRVTIRIYSNEDELIKNYLRGDVDSMSGVSPEKLTEVHNDSEIVRSPLPRIFAVFFNQSKAPVFTHLEVRKALDVALDKERIVNEVLGGYGTEIKSPIPPGVLRSSVQASFEKSSRIERAKEILERNGWAQGDEGIWKKTVKKSELTLSFSIATSNTPELKAAAAIIKDEWEKLGAQVTLRIFEPGDLNQNVIRPREYEALLFGEIVGRELDLFAFWHSSQRNDPGLNIALYANITADRLLEEARTLSEREERIKRYEQFEEEIKADIPAVFMYAPDFIYVTPKKVQGLELGSVTTSGERFLNIHEWYIETDKVWYFFEN
jgi:peptide/nickel transport system substrate-binding protein|tara:strand:- start:18286 stop:20058 length:1773 start_codon:yes stop_codon:yes gene_type:complete